MTTYTFRAAFNQHLSNLKLVSKIQAQAKYMLLPEATTKVTCGVVTVKVECDTPHEVKILEKMYAELQKQAV
jgi:hypothetical protein